MDCRNGDIYRPQQTEELRKYRRDLVAHFREMKVPPTGRQLATHKVGRNDPCPCGSHKKFKRCCLGSTDNAEVK